MINAQNHAKASAKQRKAVIDPALESNTAATGNHSAVVVAVPVEEGKF
jgi:hypothetical protein